MRAFHAVTGGYINWDYTGLVCLVFENLDRGWTCHVNEEMKCGQPFTIAAPSQDGSLSPLTANQYMIKWSPDGSEPLLCST